MANYRIQRLIDKGIVRDFYTLVNVGSLELNSYYVFLQLKSINKEKEKELLEKIQAQDFVGWLVSGTGRWDAVVLIYANSTSLFDMFLNQLVNLCGDNLHEYNFSTMISAEHISYKFIDDSIRNSLKQTERVRNARLDSQDKKILMTISQEARIPLTVLARKTKLPLHIVNYRLKRLVKHRIIEGFKPRINVNRLGYQWHLLLIQLDKVSKTRKIEFINFCKHHPKVYYLTNTVGLYNMMIDIHVRSSEEFKEVLLNLKDKFSDIIKLYESMIIFDEYKISYVPEKLIWHSLLQPLLK